VIITRKKRVKGEKGKIEMVDEKKRRQRYVVITPVRNEEKYLERTILSVIGQTVRPAEWVIVDDGSSDRTGEIIDNYAAKYKWIRALHRANRGFRKPGGGVVNTFNDGYRSLVCRDWDFVVKLDGDLSFEADYFEKIINRFMAEPKLGIGGGTLYCISNGLKRIERGPRFHVRGPTKVYRRECWEQIGGLWAAAGWDTVDEVKANMLGWKTMSVPDIYASHNRATGTADGIWSDSVKRGLICYAVGYHPLFTLARLLYHATNKPYAVRSIGMAYGFLRAHLTSVPRINEAPFIHFVRKEQMNRLRGRQTIWK
jgi:poly-beta-1,6-N-acetyl-D-glucosamine synthase